jgi:hypothetical protein
LLRLISLYPCEEGTSAQPGLAQESPASHRYIYTCTLHSTTEPSPRRNAPTSLLPSQVEISGIKACPWDPPRHPRARLSVSPETILHQSHACARRARSCEEKGGGRKAREWVELMGRAPCRDRKQGLKKGPWKPEEDKLLVDYIQANGHGSWSLLPKLAGLHAGPSQIIRFQFQ